MKLSASELRRVIRNETKSIIREVARPHRRSLSSLIFEEDEKADSRPKLFVLVGPPSVGKSTWITETFKDKNPYVVNRDDIVDEVASANGWTYDDMFVTPPPDAQVGDVDEKYGVVEEAPSWMTWAKSVFSKVSAANNDIQSKFNQKVSGAGSSNTDVVVDMTNMNAGARAGAIKMIGDADYEKIAVVFEFDGAQDIIKQVSEKRAEAAKRMGKSKTIPPAAFDRMFAAFGHPTKAEGFDQIVSVDNRKVLEKLANEDSKPPNEDSKPPTESFRIKGNIIMERWQKLAGLIK